MSKQVVMETIAVEPYIIEVTEFDRFETVGFCLDIVPAYFKCVIRITPYVIQKMLQWLLDEQLITLKGTLTVSIRGRRFKYVE